MTYRYFRRIRLPTGRKWIATASFKQEAIIGVPFESIGPDVRHFSKNAADAPDVDF